MKARKSTGKKKVLYLRHQHTHTHSQYLYKYYGHICIKFTLSREWSMSTLGMCPVYLIEINNVDKWKLKVGKLDFTVRGGFRMRVGLALMERS